MDNSKTNFQLVSEMNAAFGNPKGNPDSIDISRLRNQCVNILDEFGELMISLGANKSRVLSAISNFKAQLVFDSKFEDNLDDVRDALCDIHVFAYGAHHFMGVDADRDMTSVVSGVMTRFVKNEADRLATIEKHEAKGVTEVYFEGDYPTMIMKSASDQPDAPKGKFLKSASYAEPVFYDVGEVKFV